jgi:GH24 family phage-related lysozyme (muramidase)
MNLQKEGYTNYNALVSLLWNCGAKTLTQSDSGQAIIEALNQEPPQYDKAAEAIASYEPTNNGVPNEKRRAREATLFLT